MTHGSLFSGIGGFDLAADWMGWTNVFHCEMNPFGQRVLAHHFPNSKLHEDVKTFPASDYVGRIDILTGGFPCQPYSAAGKRLGKDDDRHLWPYMLEIIRTIRPRYVVGENVRGLVNWNGGLVFDEVQADLEFAGYDVLPFILPAASVNAPHRRDRVWFIARNTDSGRERKECKVQERSDEPPGDSERLRRVVAHANGCADLRTSRTDASASQGQGLQKRDEVRQPDESSGSRATADASRKRRPARTNQRAEYQPNNGKEVRNLAATTREERATADTNNAGTHKFVRSVTNRQEENERRERQPFPELGPCCGNAADSMRSGGGQDNWQGESRQPNETGAEYDWSDFPTFPPICGGNDGLPRELDGITFPKWRAESIKAYGNAIVPQVALQIFKAIQDTDQ
jgi:DNA (cytosine-5)-methyltransferase 1